MKGRIQVKPEWSIRKLRAELQEIREFLAFGHANPRMVTEHGIYRATDYKHDLEAAINAREAQ